MTVIVHPCPVPAAHHAALQDTVPSVKRPFLTPTVSVRLVFVEWIKEGALSKPRMASK